MTENKPGEFPPNETRAPNSEELASPLFEAIWQAIKGWDLQRKPGAGYAGANGNDVATILDAIYPVIEQSAQAMVRAARADAFEEAANQFRQCGETAVELFFIDKARKEREKSK